MTLEEIYYVGQTIAVIAIIGSLFALIAQNRAAQKLVRDGALRHQLEGLQNISRVLFETPGMAEIWVGGMDGFERLSAEDRLRFMAFVTYALRIWEGLHLQWRNGHLGDAVWRGHLHMLRGMQAVVGVSQVWEQRGHAFTEEFQQFYAGNLPQAGVPDTRGAGTP